MLGLGKGVADDGALLSSIGGVLSEEEEDAAAAGTTNTRYMRVRRRKRRREPNGKESTEITRRKESVAFCPVWVSIRRRGRRNRARRYREGGRCA